MRDQYPGELKPRIHLFREMRLLTPFPQAESNIVQSLYRALKKAPATHKLGALYVIDSVVRQWIEKAKQNGQDLNIEGRGEPGTYPAAVKRVTELLPALFDDIMRDIPQEQKPKLENMIAIWEKGSTFPAKLLAEFRSKLSNSSPPMNGISQAPAPVKSIGAKFTAPIPSRPVTTPVGLPPKHLYEQGMLPRTAELPKANGATSEPKVHLPQQAAAPPPIARAPPAQDVNSILAALANAVPKASAPTAVAPPPPPPPPPPPQQQQAVMPSQQALLQQLPPNLVALFNQPNGAPAPLPLQPTQPQAPAYSAPPVSAPIPLPGYQISQGYPGYSIPPSLPSVPQSYSLAGAPAQQTPAPAVAADPLAPLRGILPPNILNDQGKLVMALNLLQDLQKQGLPMDQWGPVLKAFDDAQPATQPQPTHDQYGRRRSRSPDRGRGRGSPIYGTYDEIAGKRDADDDHARGRARYRQRSPIMRDSPGPLAMNGMPMQPKYIALDTSLPPDNIKVLSRTLFVGGANGTQQEIQALFERFGRVQTCIANRDKRHAFVKMTTRQYALAAKQGVDELQSRGDREVLQIARQTKWGVGFGPRECCDYQKGESVIPIPKLTEADVKWLLTAEYGGTGGKKLEGGMVLEEPDIEIGAGVSSKAMSKRVVPDSGPPTSNKRQKEEGGGGGGSNKKHHHHHHHHKKQHDYDRDVSGYGQGGVYGGNATGAPMLMEAYGYQRPEPVAVATPPAVPTFGFSLPQSGAAAPAPPYR